MNFYFLIKPLVNLYVFVLYFLVASQALHYSYCKDLSTGPRPGRPTPGLTDVVNPTKKAVMWYILPKGNFETPSVRRWPSSFVSQGRTQPAVAG